MAVFKDNWNGYEGKKWRVQIRYVDWQGKKREHNKRGLATKKEALEYVKIVVVEKSIDKIVMGLPKNICMQQAQEEDISLANEIILKNGN